MLELIAGHDLLTAGEISAQCNFVLGVTRRGLRDMVTAGLLRHATEIPESRVWTRIVVVH